MILLQSWFANPYDTKNISDDNIKKFVQKHIAQTTAKNGGGLFTTMLADTTLAYTNYFGAIDDEDVKLAVQQSLTMAADNLIKTFKDSVSQQEGLIRSFYNVNSPAYQEFFPHGVTEYREANKGNIDTLMNRMAVASQAHVGDLGAPFVAIWTGIKSNYATARTSQLGKIAEVVAAKTTTSDNRNELETQIFKNMFTVGMNFPGNVDECMDFFDQSIIRANQSSASDGLGRARGIITSSVGGVPVINAVFEFPEEGVASRKSKDGGNFLSVNVRTGSRLWRVTHPDFQTKEGNIDIVDDGDTSLNVDLDPV
jgi:hypothetical protein